MGKNSGIQKKVWKSRNTSAAFYCAHSTHKKLVFICDFAGADRRTERTNQILSQRTLARLGVCRDLSGNTTNLFLTRAESVICDEGVLDRSPVWVLDIQTSVKPPSCGTKRWKMEIIHVFSALNDIIKTTSDGCRDIPFSLGCCFFPFRSHHLRTLRTGSSDDPQRNIQCETDQFLHLQLYLSQKSPSGKTNQSSSFPSSSSPPLWPLPAGSTAARGLLLPSPLSLLLRWLGGLQGPGSPLPAPPSPPASGESLPPARQQQSCLAGSLCLCQPLVSGGVFTDAVKAYVPPSIS